MKMPVLFVGHGTPMNAIRANEFRSNWESLGQRLPRPKSILCISAHWETRGTYVTATASPETIHDFYGFPKALFDVRYAAPGDPALAARVAALVTSERVRLDPGRGLDHGAWAVLVAMYPQADLPVVQLSMDTSRPASEHVTIARQLAPLREEGVLVIGSGNIVHNLALLDYRDLAPREWALAADATVRAMVAERRLDELTVWPGLPQARLAVPTVEHYLPLLYPVALQQVDETAEFFSVSVLGTISMSSVLIGAAARA